MNVALWILQGPPGRSLRRSLCVKVSLSLTRLAGIVGGWVDDVPGPLVRTIGVLEICGASLYRHFESNEDVPSRADGRSPGSLHRRTFRRTGRIRGGAREAAGRASGADGHGS